MADVCPPFFFQTFWIIYEHIIASGIYNAFGWYLQSRHPCFLIFGMTLWEVWRYQNYECQWKNLISFCLIIEIIHPRLSSKRFKILNCKAEPYCIYYVPCLSFTFQTILSWKCQTVTIMTLASGQMEHKFWHHFKILDCKTIVLSGNDYKVVQLLLKQRIFVLWKIFVIDIMFVSWKSLHWCTLYHPNPSLKAQDQHGKASKGQKNCFYYSSIFERKHFTIDLGCKTQLQS